MQASSAGNTASKLGAGAGHMPVVRPLLEQQAVTFL